MAATATAATLAKLFHLHERRVRQLGQEGIIPRPQHGKYDLIGSVQGYVKYLQERAEGRRDETSGVHDERMRLLTAQAEHKELEVAALHRSLLPYNEVVAAWEQLVAAFRARCLALPSKLAPRLIHMLGSPHRSAPQHGAAQRNTTQRLSIEQKTIQTALTVEIREALQELSRFDLAGKPAARRAQGGARGEPPAGANGKSVGRSKLAIKPGGQRRARTIPVH